MCVLFLVLQETHNAGERAKAKFRNDITKARGFKKSQEAAHGANIAGMNVPSPQSPLRRRSFNAFSSGDDRMAASFNALASLSWSTKSHAEMRRRLGVDGPGAEPAGGWPTPASKPSKYPRFTSNGFATNVRSLRGTPGRASQTSVLGRHHLPPES